MNIREKCEQYWNEPTVCIEEVHAILEWIHEKSREELKHARSEALESVEKIVEKHKTGGHYTSGNDRRWKVCVEILKEIRAFGRAGK